MLKLTVSFNKSRIYILQLAKSRGEYFRNLHQPNLKENNFYNIREAYIEFIKNDKNNKINFYPKCIVIGTLPYFDTSFEDLVNLYIKTFKKISNKFKLHR